jgi:hypothetical protein
MHSGSSGVRTLDLLTLIQCLTALLPLIAIFRNFIQPVLPPKSKEAVELEPKTLGHEVRGLSMCFHFWQSLNP